MKRSELYARVWATPLRTLGPELGMSDVGLLKLCRRHQIPTPGLGYWAKVQAGQKPPQTRLPAPESDPEVLNLAAKQRPLTVEQQASMVMRSGRRSSAPSSLRAVAIPSTLDGCHPIVAKTAKYFEMVRRELDEAARQSEKAARAGRPNFSRLHIRFDQDPLRLTFGRYTCAQPGCLHIAAKLDSVDWILRLHEALLRALEASGHELTAGGTGEGLQVSDGSERVALTFVEQVDRVDKDAYGLKREYRSRGTFKLTLAYQVGGARAWSGTPAEMEQQLGKITASIAAAPPEQAKRRATHAALRAAQEEREQAALKRHREEIRRANHLAAQRSARAAQRERALAVIGQSEERARIMSLLAELGRRLPTEPGARAAVEAWSDLVRQRIVDPIDGLIAEIVKEGTAERPPLWWPDDPGSNSMSTEPST